MPSTTMKAARVHAPNDLRIETMERPAIAHDDDVAIRIHACGICPSDVRSYTGLRGGRTFPYTPGHEWAGEVVGVGAGVEEFTVGDRVVPSWRVVCGECIHCLRGRHNFCENLLRGRVIGGFAEYGVTPAISLLKIPDSVSYVQAAFCEPVACCINGSLDSNINFGDDVVIVGGGPIGLQHLQLARHAGARVVVSDLIPSRLEKAKELGAFDVILASEEDPVARVKEMTGGYGADVVIAAVGAPVALKQALDMVGACGTVNFFAGTYPPTTLDIDPNFIHYQQIHLTGSHDFTPYHFRTALRFIETGTVDVLSLISHTLPLAQTKEGMDIVAAQAGLKVMITMD